LSGLGLLGLSLPSLPLKSFFQGEFDSQQGRVTTRLIWLYDKPSFKGLRLKMYWRDAVVPISDITVSDQLTDTNRVWYQIGNEGYAYSGTVQPVRTLLNSPISTVPSAGILGEVSVPFTDAHADADENSPVVYRLYYESVHWIMSAKTSSVDGKIWYQVLDDKWNKHYYAHGEHLRILPDEELTPLSPDVPAAQKKIQVQLDDQLMFAYENGSPVFAARVSSGSMLEDGTYTTPTGTFMTYHKRPTRHMASGDLTASGFDLPGVPWVMYINEAGVSLHGTYWHNDFGTPHSHGCVNLSTATAKWLFRWTRPILQPSHQFAYESTGTLVEINK
jgi:lipoprotein-anchoring transpeptidase ErfK/SrfK